MGPTTCPMTIPRYHCQCMCFHRHRRCRSLLTCRIATVPSDKRACPAQAPTFIRQRASVTTAWACRARSEARVLRPQDQCQDSCQMCDTFPPRAPPHTHAQHRTSGSASDLLHTNPVQIPHQNMSPSNGVPISRTRAPHQNPHTVQLLIRSIIF